MGKSSTVATIDVLTPIWQRVLQHPSVRAEDNFFDLGGDPSLAVQLFKEIANAFGRELPPLTIYQAPTLAALTVLLEGATVPPFPTLIRLKEGEAESPIFITHGLGGSVMEVFYVVEGIQSRHPIYGLQSRGLDGKVEPLTRVEDMAEYYLGVITNLQPRGPYALIGYSFGGLVMMEIAQQLHERGEKVALLAMLETYPHRNHLPLKIRLGLFAARAKRHASILRKLTMEKRVAYLTRRSERRLYAYWSDKDDGRATREPETGLLFATGVGSVRHAESLALARYRPRFYPGKINYVKASVDLSLFPNDLEGIWGKLAEKFEVDTVPCAHFGIVTTQCQEVAAILSRHLAAAFSGE